MAKKKVKGGIDRGFATQSVSKVIKEEVTTEKKKDVAKKELNKTNIVEEKKTELKKEEIDEDIELENIIKEANRLESKAQKRVTKIEEHIKVLKSEPNYKNLPTYSIDSNVNLCEELIKWAKEKEFLKIDEYCDSDDEEKEKMEFKNTNSVPNLQKYVNLVDEKSRLEKNKVNLYEVEIFAVNNGFDQEEVRQAINTLGNNCGISSLLDYLILHTKDASNLPAPFKDSFISQDALYKKKDYEPIEKVNDNKNENRENQITEGNGNASVKNKINRGEKNRLTNEEDKIPSDIEELYYFSSDEEDYSLEEEVNQMYAQGMMDKKVYQELESKAINANHVIFLYVIKRKMKRIEEKLKRMETSLHFREKEVSYFYNQLKEDAIQRTDELKDFISVTFDEEIKEALTKLKEKRKKEKEIEVNNQIDDEPMNFEDLFEEEKVVDDLTEANEMSPSLCKPDIDIDLSIPKSWTGKTPRQVLTSFGKSKKAEFKYNTNLNPLLSKLTVIYKHGNSTINETFNSNQLLKLNQQYDSDNPKPKYNYYKVNSKSEVENLVSTIALFELKWISNFNVLPSNFKLLSEFWQKQQILNLKKYQNKGLLSRSHFINSILESGNNKFDKPKESALIRDREKFSNKTKEINKNINKLFNPYWSKQKKTIRDLFNERIENREYNELLSVRKKLPIYEYKQQLISSLYPERFSQQGEIDTNIKFTQVSTNIILVVGETGCGKTTQVPQFLVEDAIQNDNGLECKIYCTQPRRISAISIAERVSQELGDGQGNIGALGSLVGYQIRLASKSSSSNLLTFCTMGVLLRHLEEDPKLNNLTHLIIDEIQERSLESDFLLTVIRKLLINKTHLKIVLMSATIDANTFSSYLFGCPILKVPGRTFPVQVQHLDEFISNINYILDKDSKYSKQINDFDSYHKINNTTDDYSTSDNNNSYDNSSKMIESMRQDIINYDLILSLLKFILKPDKKYESVIPSGAILIFLPGIPEIKILNDILNAESQFQDQSKVVILQAHSAIAAEKQSEIFKLYSNGTRKIVLATNIAETGITIPDITIVIDTGKMKQIRYDKKLKVRHLQEVFISQANAKQRLGRAGRVQSGLCFRLFTKEKFNSMIPYQIPEMKRLPLEELCLKVKVYGYNNILQFLQEAIDPPPLESIKNSISLLQEVGALTNKEELTPLGVHLSKLPVDIFVGKVMIYGALFKCIDPTLTIASIMSYKSIYINNSNQDSKKKRKNIANCDFISQFKAYEQWRNCMNQSNAWEAIKYCKNNNLSHSTLMEIETMKKQYLTLLASIGFISLEKNYKKVKIHRDICMVPESFNINSNSNNVIKCALSGGLYPKVLIFDEPTFQLYKPSFPASSITHLNYLSHLFKIPSQANALSSTTLVRPSPASLFYEIISNMKENNSYKKNEIPFVIYNDMIKGKVHLTTSELSSISPLPLLLFGKDLLMIHNSKLCIVDQTLKFKINGRVAAALIQLRQELNNLLEKLITNKQPLSVLLDKNLTKPLELIIELCKVETD